MALGKYEHGGIGLHCKLSCLPWDEIVVRDLGSSTCDTNSPYDKFRVIYMDTHPESTLQVPFMVSWV